MSEAFGVAVETQPARPVPEIAGTAGRFLPLGACDLPVTSPGTSGEGGGGTNSIQVARTLIVLV